MKICKQCDRNHHLRCEGCDCIFCPIYNRSSIAKITPIKSPSRARTSSGGGTGRPGRPRLSMDENLRISIAEDLVNLVPVNKLARTHHISRDRIRTIRNDLDKLALAAAEV